MPSGRRMSSPCTMISPSQVVFGPGGAVVRSFAATKRAKVAAGPPADCSAISLSAKRSKLKPDPIILPKNFGGVMSALPVWWASTSCTVHRSHSDGVRHCSSLRFAMSAARADRSAWTTGQMSAMGGSCHRRSDAQHSDNTADAVAPWRASRDSHICRRSRRKLGDDHPEDLVSDDLQTLYGGVVNRRVTTRDLQSAKDRGEKW